MVEKRKLKLGLTTDEFGALGEILRDFKVDKKGQEYKKTFAYHTLERIKGILDGEQTNINTIKARVVEADRFTGTGYSLYVGGTSTYRPSAAKGRRLRRDTGDENANIVEAGG